MNHYSFDMNDRQRLPTGDDKRPQAEALWPAGFGAWIKIGVVYQRTSARLAALLRPLSLTVAQFDALANLYVDDGISQQRLAQRLLVTKGNVSGLTDRLAAGKLVERRADPDDGRSNLIFLTRSGRRLARKALEVQRGLVDEMMTPLSQQERQTLRNLLARLSGDDDT